MLTFQANPEQLLEGLGEAGVKRSLEEKAGETSVKTRVETPDRIIELLRAHPHLTQVEVAAQIGKSPRTIARATTKLIREGRLRRVGPRKGGHWEVLK